jgi:hypothetical protein
MTDQLLITWIIFLIFALCIDIGAYIALRVIWKRKGVVPTDEFWNLVEARLGQGINVIIDRLSRIRLQLPQAPALSQTPKPTPAPDKVPAEVPDEIPAGVELIPYYVKTIDNIRQVQFSFEMPLNTKINVRIGATGENGIQVEKRELWDEKRETRKKK